MTGTRGAAAAEMVERQNRLRAHYREAPEDARIVDRGRTSDGDISDPVHVWGIPGSQPYGIEWKLGLHRAVAGLHDLPNPGDLLCLALAACLDSVIRMVAARHGVRIEHLEVDVGGEVDVRGTLWVSREVRVGFSRLRCHIRLKPVEGTDPGRLEQLLAAAEHSCVNLDTLRRGVPVEIQQEIL